MAPAVIGQALVDIFRGDRALMEWVGLALLALVGVGIILTGLPAAVVLIAVATLGAIIGVATGAIEVRHCSAPCRPG